MAAWRNPYMLWLGGHGNTRRERLHRLNQDAHALIRRDSPLQPGDVIHRPTLDAYVRGLNRHTGRRVEAALSRSDETSAALVLKFRVFAPPP